MQAGKKVIEIQYKINTGSEGNIKLFKNITEEQLKKSIKSHIRLRTYNNTNIMQLWTCAVVTKFKNIKKRCVFFVVPGNGQALLRMPDTAALKLINLNIDSIQAEVPERKTNTKQEMHVVAKGTYMDMDSKTTQGANGQNSQNNANKSINYFFSSSNVDADKGKSSDMTQKIHNMFGDVFNGIGCFKGTFSLQLKPDSKPYQMPPRHVAYVLQKPIKEE